MPRKSKTIEAESVPENLTTIGSPSVPESETTIASRSVPESSMTIDEQSEPKDRRRALMACVRGTYDLQGLRVAMGLRIVGQFKARLGLGASQKERDLDATGQKILKDLRARYRRITDGIASFTDLAKTFKGDGMISDYAELVLLKTYFDMLKVEDESFKTHGPLLDQFPVWHSFLRTVKGIGDGLAISGFLLASLDPHRARHASSWIRYCMLDTGEDGRGRSMRKEHLVERQYVAKDGTIKTKVGPTGNPWLMGKLIGALAPCLMRANDHYKRVYDGYRARLEDHPVYGAQNDKIERDNWLDETSKSRRNRMAIRYMVKQFLRDFFAAYRAVEGYPPEVDYFVARANAQAEGFFKPDGTPDVSAWNVVHQQPVGRDCARKSQDLKTV